MIFFLVLLAFLYADRKWGIENDLFAFLAILAMVCWFFEVCIEVTAILLLLES